jgi:hypothetical protein
LVHKKRTAASGTREVACSHGRTDGASDLGTGDGVRPGERGLNARSRPHDHPSPPPAWRPQHLQVRTRSQCGHNPSGSGGLFPGNCGVRTCSQSTWDSSADLGSRATNLTRAVFSGVSLSMGCGGNVRPYNGGHECSSGGGIHGGVMNGAIGIMAGGVRRNVMSMSSGTAAS